MMPRLKGISCHVTDTQGQALQEWGIQYLRQHTETNRVSAYVRSTTDASFQISLQPEIPFPSPGALRGEDFATTQQPTHRRARSADRSTHQDHGEMGSNTLSSPVRPSRNPQSDSPPNFAFLAVLYLDGRRKPERKIIVYTDPADEDFNSPNGKVTFKHRWVQSADGKMIEHAWVFKEKAIETLFDRLMIEGSQANLDDQNDDALIKAMESAGFDEGHIEKAKVGQIVVELRRIVLGEKRIEANYRSHHQEGQDEDSLMEVRPDIIHETGFIRQNIRNPQPLRVVEYWPFKPSDGVYATFQFFYRSREQLQKFHFPGFAPLATTAARTERLAELTPLSISQPLDKKTKRGLSAQASYEAKVKKRSFMPDDIQKHDLGSKYRGIRSASTSALDEAFGGKKPPIYPAAPLPFLTNQLLEKSRVDALSPNTGLIAARTSCLAGKSMATDLRPKLQAQRQANQPSNLNTHAPITAEASSSPSLSTNVTKEQLAKITAKGDYRLPAGESYPSDQEDNANDELETESDLETHAGDDDFNYSTHLEEEDEGYDSLQSHFKSVKIRKRQRDDVEDAEDHNEAWQTDGLAHFVGDGKQKTVKMRLTDEERTRQGKKSRTAKLISATDSSQAARVNEKTEGVGLV